LKLSRSLVLGLWILAASVAAPVYASTPTESHDIRIVIDVSGSMKQNDPNNLRAPALQLLVKLIPGDARAGVWLFSTEAQRVIAPTRVDSTWRQRAGAASKRITSKGMFTDIGKAIRAASQDWKPADEQTADRSVIFLTDGLVDVAKDPAKNQAAREEILAQILPELKAQQAQIIAIALSKNADIPLLQKLAVTTGGWFQLAESSAALEKMFFKAFEKAVPRDTVPMKGNEFQIDASVSEFTLLAFRKPGAPEAELQGPNGEKSNAKHAQKGVSWFAQEGYDLITANKPAAGTWRLLADLDPDNRVMVVTDLAVKTNKVPNNLALGESIILNTWLTEKGNPISRPDFLKLVNIEAAQHSNSGEKNSWSLADNGIGADEKEADGVFTLALDETLIAGEHELLLSIDGKTFKREQRYSFRVHETPVMLEAKPDEQAAQRSYLITATPNADLINLETAKIGLSVKTPSGQKSLIAMQAADHGTYVANLANLEPKGDYIVTVTAKGATHDGRAINLTLEPLVLAPPAPKAPIHEAAHEVAHEPEPPAQKPEETSTDEATEHETAEHEESNEHDAEPEAIEEEEEAEPEEEEEPAEEPTEDSHETEPAAPEGEHPADPRMQWIIAIGLLIGINTVILVGCIFGYKAWKKKQLNSVPQISTNTESSEPTTAPEEPASGH
jgi:uncharacterized protein (TIGR03503 family)